MKRILVTQRVDREPTRGERRDALDQAWHAFLADCDLLPLLVPNHAGAARALLSTVPFDGVLLTGGNDLASVGGDAPERDEVELLLLRRAIAAGLPVLGVCRGMQIVLQHFGVGLIEVEGHVQSRLCIRVEGLAQDVNSYHRWGCRETCPELEVWARAEDGVVKAVRHRELPLFGVMWHPERMEPFRAADVALFRKVYADGPWLKTDGEREPRA